MLRWLRSLMGTKMTAKPESSEDLCRPPVSFGYKTSWMAIPTTDGIEVAKSMGRSNPIPCSWERGIDEAYNLRGTFVTPAVQKWTFVVGANDSGDEIPLETLKSLSRNFGKTYYFANHRIVDLYAWAIAENGNIVRAFHYAGEFDMNLGERTPEEIEVGAGLESADEFPDEETVLTLASLWTLDPRELEQYPTSIGPGTLCPQSK